MKKVLQSLALLALLAFMPSVANAYTCVVEDYTGATDTGSIAPLRFYNTDYYYCRSQFIYNSSYLTDMKGKVITSMKFFANSSLTTGGTAADAIVVKVKLGISPDLYFESGSSWKTTTTNTVLYGKVTRSGNNLIISFNTGFYYPTTGGHLLVEVENINPAVSRYFGSSSTKFYGYRYTSSNRCAWQKVHVNNGSYPVTSTPNLAGFTPKCEFTYWNKDEQEASCHWTFYGSTSHADEWISLNGDCMNQWIVGDSIDAVDADKYSLYVCSHPTLGASYVGSYTNAFVYRFVKLKPNTEYIVSYDWRCNGESTYDYMRVGLVNASTSESTLGMTPGNSSTAAWASSTLPSGVIALDGGSKLNLENSWQHKVVKIKTPASVEHYKFVVYWRNDLSTVHQTAAAIDNISIMPIQEGAYHSDFETSPWDTWCWSNGSGIPTWGAGDDVYFSGNQSMYVGQDGGHDYGYTTDQTDTCFAYFPIRLKAGKYLVSYNWKGVGEASWDFMRVGFTQYTNKISAAVGVPSGNIPCDGGLALAGQADWTYKAVTVTIPTDTIYYFYLMWKNDGSGGNANSPAAVDNLSITKVATTLPVSYNFNTANVATEKYFWTYANGAQTNHWVRSPNGTPESGAALHVTNAAYDATSFPLTYTITSASTALVYTAVDLAAGKYDISFRWKNSGETNYDFVRAVLLPQNVAVAPDLFSGHWNNGNIPTGAISVSDRLSGQTTFQTVTTTVNITTAGTYRLCFIWRNDDSQGSTPPASIDDVNIQVHKVTVTGASNNNSYGTVSGGGDFVPGSSCTLTATAASGYHFDHWQDGNTTNPRTITVPENNVTYTATFVANSVPTYHITVNSNNSNWGTTTGTGTYSQGATVTISATPNSGYHFVKWTQDNNTSPSRSITVTADATYTAEFAEDIPEITYYDIDVVSSNPEWGNVFGTGHYAEGSTIEIKAMPYVGYKFVRWEEDGSTEPIRNITVTANATYTAYFTDEGVGIDDVDGLDLVLFPNPASTTVTLRGIEDNATVSVVDLNGRELLRETAHGESLTLDVSGFAKGAYFVRVTGQSGTAVRKLIVR